MENKDLSQNKKQYCCRHCLKFHDLFYLSTFQKNQPVTHLVYLHNKTLVYIPHIPDLPISTQLTKKAREKENLKNQGNIFAVDTPGPAVMLGQDVAAVPGELTPPRTT